MAPGRILVGNGDGTCLLKFVGDVRLRLGAAFDEYLDRLLRTTRLHSVVVDMSATEGIDSTSLGVLARLAMCSKKRLGCPPTLVSTRTDITRLLQTMGLDDAFHIVAVPLEHERQLGELPRSDLPPGEVRQRVLAAHRHLMALNDDNRDRFEDLVASLETAD